MAGDLLGHLEWLTPYRLFTCSWVFRLVLILYGEVHDRLMDVKFTDIDYRVFSDAASHVLNGSSPYERHTYRYTPLLAWLLVPNHILLYSFGKLVFITLDVLAGGVMYKMLRLQKMPERSAVLSCLLWLANPLTAVVSSRGNAESIMAFLILSCLFLLMRGKVSSSAVLYGLAVHTKIYPIIYCVPLMLNIGPTPWVRATPTGLVIKWHLFVTPSRLKFAFISFATFLVTSSVCYLMYGWQYLHEALLYHVTRTDIRHNFSVYFYMLYLTQGTWVGPFISLLTFFPQFLLVIMGGVKYHRDLPFCFFVQTFLFVTFNKVCTSQYFLWYLTFLPLVVPAVSLKMNEALLVIIVWFGAQGLWLFSAYLLEFHGLNTFLFVWIAGLGFFVANVWIISLLNKKYNDRKKNKKNC